MEISVAIKRPFSDAKTLIIGIALSIIPIVNFIAIGYFLETAKATTKKNYKLLEWKNFKDLFITGLSSVLIGLVYAIPVVIVAAIGLGVPILSLATGDLSTGLPTLGIGLIVFLLLALLVSYVLPAAYLNYVISGKLSKGFALKEISKKAFNSKYFAAWLVGASYSGTISLVLFFLFFFMPWIGLAIGSFVGGVTMYTLLGEAWSSSK